jgi:glycosyltransferase involved in cell wall biosynthesis
VGHLVKELADEWEKRGCSVTVVTSGQADPADKASPWKVCRVKALPFTRKNFLLRAFSYLSLYPGMLWTAAMQRRPDVIVTTTDPPLQAVVGVALATIFRCKLIHWCQDLYPEMAEEAGVLKKQGLFANLLRKISTAALQRHDKIVSIGRCMTARLRTRGLSASRITEIANWTDPEMIHPVENTANRFLKRENLVARFVVLYSGNLGLAHSFEEILDAAERLQREAPDVLFLFIGDGPRRAQAERDASERNLANTRFLPPQPWKTLPESLGAGHLHLVTLRANISGLVVPSKFYGGMASGRPCLFIGPGDSEVARLIAEHELGRVVAPGDGAGLSAAILAYRDDPVTLEEQGRQARLFGQRSTLSRSAGQFADLF